MAEQKLGPRDFFSKEDAIADLGLIACPGAEDLCHLVDGHLVRWANAVGIPVNSFIIPSDCPRFQSGDAKGLVKASTRGDDLYIFVDPGNYNVTYKLFGYENHLSPDDHFQNLIRVIAAVAGRAHRITVIMPNLYGGRQHRRVVRESLDCACALQRLRDMGVKNIITFDAHDPRVVNAVPLMSFDNVMPTYQVLKCLMHHVPGVNFDSEHFMVVSPDEGAMQRNMYYSSVLGCNLGMFYKRRDYTRVVNGRNPIVAHEYLGESVKDKDVFICDDIIASGESMLDIGYELKKRGAKNIYTCATFPLFTAGLEKFDKAYQDGIITAVLGTNLTYRTPELLSREWYFDVDVSKYTAYFIAAINHDRSVTSIIDPISKIRTLLNSKGITLGGE
jgi:ribose-phosphate pyrophosphokinase